MRDFKDKVAVITGAASGIGFGIANKCIQEGMNVVLADKNDESLNRTAKIMKKEGASVIAVKVDVSKASDLEKLAKKTIDTFGVIHMLFNNAGVQLLNKTILDSTLNDWKWIISVNLWGVIHGIKVFVPIMIEQDIEGYIINTSSIFGLTGGVSGSYSVTKHAVVALSEALDHKLKQIGAKIKVSVICPGLVVSRLGQCEQNRPTELENEQLTKAISKKNNHKAIVSDGIRKIWKRSPMISAEKAAEIIFQGIKKEKFYILTHKELYWKNAVKSRMEKILNAFQSD